MLKKNQGGQALILVTYIMIIVFIVAIAGFYIGNSHWYSSSLEHKKMQSFYNADSGIEIIIAMLAEEPDLVNDWKVNQVIIKRPEVEVKVEQKLNTGYSNELVLNSTGYDDIGKTTLLVKIEVGGPLDFTSGCWADEGIFVDCNANVYSNLISSGDIKLLPGVNVFGNINCNKEVSANQAFVEGNIFSWGNVTISENTRVNGSIYTIDSVFVCDESDVDGDILEGQAPGIKVPAIPKTKPGYYKQQADVTNLENELIEEEDLVTIEFTPEQNIQGICYFEGNLNISGWYTGDAVVAVTGNITIVNDLQPVNNGSDRIVLVSFNDVDILANTSALVFSEGNVTIKDNTILTGSVIAGRIEIGNKGKFIFAPQMMEPNTQTQTNTIKILSWQERPVFQ